jgi:hypothetical protein
MDAFKIFLAALGLILVGLIIFAVYEARRSKRQLRRMREETDRKRGPDIPSNFKGRPPL